MKKVLIAIIICISSVAMAQRGGGKINVKNMVDKQYTEITTRITTLSETQKTSLKEVYSIYEKDITAVRNAADRQEKKTILLKAEEDKDASIQKILDAEQLKIYETLKTEWKEKRMEKRMNRKSNK
jgi:hypothetical protein